MKFAREFGYKNKCNLFLFDSSQTVIVGSLVDTYTTATVPIDEDRSQMNQRIAIVYKGDITEEENILENVVVNRGYSLRVLNQIEKTKRWLNPSLN